MPAHPRLPTSQRQKDLLRALWSTGTPHTALAVALSADRAPGEPKFDKNQVMTLRKELGLPCRRRPGSRFMEHIDFNLDEPPLGRLPDPTIIARRFAGCRFTDARVPAPRGRVKAIVTAPCFRSGLALFEGMAS